MVKKSFLLGAAWVLSAPLSAAPAKIDYQVINKVFQQIALHVVQAEQLKDANGQDMVESLQVGFDPNVTDLEKGTFKLDAVLKLATSQWEPGKKSSLKILAAGSTNPKGPTLDFKLGLTLKTGVAALVRHTVDQWLIQKGYCSASAIRSRSAEPEDEKVNEALCEDIKKMASVKDVAEFLSLLESWSGKWLAYLNSPRIAALMSPADLKEVRHVKQFHEQLKNRSQPDSLAFVQDFGVTAFGSTKVTEYGLEVHSDSVVVYFGFESPEAAAVLEESRADLEQWAEVLSRPDGDSEKADMITGLQGYLLVLVKFGKLAILGEE